MAEASQFTFTHKELVEVLIKKANIHEGKWMLLVNFGFAAINGGPTPEQVSPAAMAVIQSVGIQKAPDDAPISLVVDASAVNPAEQSKVRGKRG
jgi:hypothetical protein